MSIIVVCLMYIFIIVYDLVPIFKNKTKREFMLYTLLLCISFILIFLILLDVKLPSPTNLIKLILKHVIKIKEV